LSEAPAALQPRRVAPESNRWIVATVDEIQPGGKKIVAVGDREVGIFNLSGEFFALRHRCPHQGGPLCVGRIAGFLRSSTPGEYVYTRPGEMLRCPWHGWEFDIRTGQSWFDPRLRVRKYEVSITPGADLIPEAMAGTLPGEAATAAGVKTPEGLEGLEPGPYVAETYPVSVEQQYVVVEVR
jgi:3-phenylpropionate/trans-cinnamate dioxygenase ferredoxin subunit